MRAPEHVRQLLKAFSLKNPEEGRNGQLWLLLNEQWIPDEKRASARLIRQRLWRAERLGVADPLAVHAADSLVALVTKETP